MKKGQKRTKAVTNKRLRRMRPESEWIVLEKPDASAHLIVVGEEEFPLPSPAAPSRRTPTTFWAHW